MKLSSLLGRALLVATALAMLSASASAQAPGPDSDISSAISFQGLISDKGGSPVPDGTYSVVVTLYGDREGTEVLWRDRYDTPVDGGLFNLYLGDGNVPLPELPTLDKPMWIGFGMEGAEEMRPLTPLSASPYALNVSDKSITTDKLVDGAVTAEKVDMDYVSSITVNGQKVSGKGTELNLRGSDRIALSFDESTGTLLIEDARLKSTGNGDDEKGSRILGTVNDYWTMRGDGGDYNTGPATIPLAGDWIGTSNNVQFDIRTFGTSVMRYHAAAAGSAPNVEGGLGSMVAAGALGSTIAGGSGHTINPDYATIGGGLQNLVAGNYGVIGGGQDNTVGGVRSTIGGGWNNNVGADNSTIGGGRDNTASGVNSTIGGGSFNTTTEPDGTIAGGVGNTNHGAGSTIGGGDGNLITAGSDGATVAGGASNDAKADFASVGGGLSNSAEGAYSAIPGGHDLETTSYAQTAVGYFNASRGAHTGPTSSDDPLLMVGNGTGNLTRSNAFEVSYNGHSTVFDLNGGGAGSPARKGATYVDNVVYAWANVPLWNVGGPVPVNADFGVASIVRTGMGRYTVTLNYLNPATGSGLLGNMAVTATINDSVDCAFIRTMVPLGPTNTFYILIDSTNCTPIDKAFHFQVTGTP